MEHIWATWRMQYIQSSNEKSLEGCILCDKPKDDKDEENYVLYRGSLSYIMLNAYPYNPGHLMVVPYRHVAKLEDLTDDERNDLFAVVSKGVALLRKALNPNGFNVGINMGKVAGAGIDDHIHVHIVPRWNGDTNFMPVLGETRVIPQALVETYRNLKPHLD